MHNQNFYKFLPNINCVYGLLATPPTAHTDHVKGMIFGMVSPLGHSFRVIGAIFVMTPQSWDMGVLWFSTSPGVFSLYPHISALGWHIKNRPDDPKTMPPVTYHAKFQVSIMIRIGCRGGWVNKPYTQFIFGRNLYRKVKIENWEFLKFDCRV